MGEENPLEIEIGKSEQLFIRYEGHTLEYKDEVTLIKAFSKLLIEKYPRGISIVSHDLDLMTNEMVHAQKELYDRCNLHLEIERMHKSEEKLD